MDIILYGTTEIGYLIASRLHDEHNVILLYEEKNELFKKFSSLDIGMVEGSGGDMKVLEQLGLHKIGLFIGCSALDEANIVACWTIKKIADTETLCFISKSSLYRNFSSPTRDQYQTPYDIDSIIWPEQLLTQDIFRIILVPDALDVEYLAGGKAKLFEYRIPRNSDIVGKPIMSCNFPRDILIAGISRDNALFIPDGSTTIDIDDKIFFIGTSPALDTLAADFFHRKQGIRTVSIIGGGSVGYLLATMLEKRKIRVKIIEEDPLRCEYLANELEKTLVLQGDGTDLELLESEAIAEADVSVCITNNDEKNLLCSLLVKQLGSRRTVTRVSNLQNYELFAKVGIDVVVSPKASALAEVLNRVQTREIDTIALIEGGKGEVMRLTVPDNFNQTRLMDLTFPAKAVVGVITRRHRVIIPNGNTMIMPGDRVKIFVMKEDAKAVRELFFS